jgi:hypothetical protein
MSVASAAATAVGSLGAGGSMAERIMQARKSPGGLASVLGNSSGNIAMQTLIAARKRKKDRANSSAVGSVTGALAGGDSGRLDTIESRIDALEGGTEEDVTQPSPTVQEENSLQPQAPSPFTPKQTVAAADMFGDSFTRKASFGPGKIITNKNQ